MHASCSRGADDKLGAGAIPFGGGGTWTTNMASNHSIKNRVHSGNVSFSGNIFCNISFTFSELRCHETVVSHCFQQDVHANPDLNWGQDHIPAQSTASQETAPPPVGETSSRRHQTSAQARWNM